MENTNTDQTAAAASPASAPAITKGHVLAMHGALGILGNRSMASVNADLRVGRMLAQVGPTAELYRKGKNRTTLDTIGDADLAKLSPIEQAALKAKIDVAHAGYDAEPAEDFTLPKGVLREADLPKEKTGDNGWQNANQLGALCADLGPLFEFPKE